MADCCNVENNKDLDLNDSDSNLSMDSTSENMEDHLEELKEHMLNRLVNTTAYFRSQQKDEPDLTCSQKFDIGQGILDRNPNVFLARFGKFLVEEDLLYFEQFSENYEVAFYLQEIHKRLQKNPIHVRNRRYEALKRLQKEGSYFSEKEMRVRDPLLYEQLIGQYLTDKEKGERDKIDKTDLKISTIILNHYDDELMKTLKKNQEDKEDDQKEESDSDEEDIMTSGQDKSVQITLSDEEKEILRQEFITSMHRHFLDGHDKDVDYSGIDSNLDYDDLEIQQLDEEEKYFDDEEPYTFHISDNRENMSNT